VWYKKIGEKLIFFKNYGWPIIARGLCIIFKKVVKLREWEATMGYMEIGIVFLGAIVYSLFPVLIGFTYGLPNQKIAIVVSSI